MHEPAVAVKQQDRRTQTILLVVAVFLFWMSMYLYVPTLPLYAQSKTNNLALVGTALAMYGLWQAILRLPMGIAADWLGRLKPYILLGIVLAGVGAWVMGAAAGIEGIIVGRAITGLAAASWVPMVTFFSALFPPREAVRAAALLSLVNSASRMLATGVTGSLNQLGGIRLAYTLATVVSIVAVFALLPVKEERKPSKAPDFAGVRALIRRRDVLLPAVLSAVGQYASWTATFSFFPILAERLGAGDQALSLMISMNIGLVLIGNLLTTALVNRIGARRLMYGSVATTALGITIASVSGALWQVFAAQLLLGLASGIGYPILMGLSIERVDAGQRSTAMGLHQAVYAIGMFAGPWLSGILADALGLQPMLGVTAAGCFIAGLIGTRFLRPDEAT